MPDPLSLAGSDRARLQVALQELSQHLGSTPSAPVLRDWALRAGLQAEVFHTMIAGSIVWRKIIGRPESHSLHEAFDVRICREKKVLDYLTGRWITLPEEFAPTIWDALPDDERYRVNFLHFGDLSGAFDVRVKLKTTPEWAVDALSQLHHVRAMRPAARPIVKDADEALIVEPFEVISRSRAELPIASP
jgi:hypothetical protein